MSQDSKLQQHVLAELNWEPSVTAAHIGVMANAGVVTLTGHVESFAEKHAAKKAAARVKGVMAVADEIEVKLPFVRTRGDDDIAAAAIERLSWNAFVPQNAIKVEVEDGWITLTGEVDMRFQKDAAEEDIRRLAGVVGVSNQITIRPGTNVSNISDISGEIENALHRGWFPEPGKITVSADGQGVRLCGTVHFPRDREVAASIAWSAPGIDHVENDIMVV